MLCSACIERGSRTQHKPRAGCKGRKEAGRAGRCTEGRHELFKEIGEFRISFHDFGETFKLTRDTVRDVKERYDIKRTDREEKEQIDCI